MSNFITVTYAGHTALVNVEQICSVLPWGDGSNICFTDDSHTLIVKESIPELAALIAKAQDTRELTAFPDALGGEA